MLHPSFFPMVKYAVLKELALCADAFFLVPEDEM
jgi:hypothetical protein